MRCFVILLASIVCSAANADTENGEKLACVDGQAEDYQEHSKIRIEEKLKELEMVLEKEEEEKRQKEEALHREEEALHREEEERRLKEEALHREEKAILQLEKERRKTAELLREIERLKELMNKK
jgi:Skp family chaperone for outer membrane proteins